MEPADIRSMLESNGEVMVAVSEFDEPLELHLHDTEVGDDSVTLELSDGEVVFDVGAVTGAWYHLHSTEDLGL